MDFQMKPFPIEKEFQVLSIRRRLKDLSRQELVEFLSDSLVLLTKLTHQVSELRDHVLELEGKNGQLQ